MKLNDDKGKRKIRMHSYEGMLPQYVHALSSKGIREITWEAIKSFAYKIALKEHFSSYHICNYLYSYFSLILLSLTSCYFWHME